MPQTTKKPRTSSGTAIAAPAPVTSPLSDVNATIERYASCAPTPKLVLRFAPGTGPRTMNEAMFRAAADIEAATPDHEGWLVQAQHRGAADRVVVTIELARGTDDEADRALAVLQTVALRLRKAVSR